MGTRRQPINCVLLSQLLLWATGAQPHWGNPGKHHRTHTSESALLRGKGAGVFIHPLLSVMVEDYSLGALPAERAALAAKEWQELAAGSQIAAHGNGKCGGYGWGADSICYYYGMGGLLAC